MQKYQLLPEHLNYRFETFINSYINEDKSQLALKIKAIKQQDYCANLLIETISNYKKALYKLPTFASNYCWLPTKSYEQASSELTAFYKSLLFKGNLFLDLCGGLGVDDIAFAANFSKVISLDTDDELNQIAKWNFNKLNIKNIARLTISAEDFIASNNQKFDLVYIDADRRPEANTKTFKLNECSPNIIDLLPAIKQTANQLLIKLSPLVDIDYCLNTLENISEVIVVSVKNEVKEVLLSIDFMNKTDIKIKAVNIIDKYKVQLFENTIETIKPIEATIPIYFFEPNAAIIKAKLSKNYAQSLGLKMLADNTHFFIGNRLPNDFMGRSFSIVKSMVFSKTLMINYIKQNNITKANISRRNFPINETEIAKQFKLKDGGDDYLFFTQNSHNQKLFFHCQKVE